MGAEDYTIAGPVTIRHADGTTEVRPPLTRSQFAEIVPPHIDRRDRCVRLGELALTADEEWEAWESGVYPR